MCSQYLAKGRRVYVEGRLSTRSFTGQLGQQKTRTEVVIEEMIMLDSKGAGVASGEETGKGGDVAPRQDPAKPQAAPKGKPEPTAGEAAEDVSPEEIPF